MEDELFLETALDDRAKDVRRTAAELLAHLPASSLVRRQVQRAWMFLQWKPGRLLRKAQIEVTLPESFDKEMQRDGVEPKPLRGRSTGEKAWWLQQILQVVPPSVWSQAWGINPEEILESAEGGDWGELLHQSWIAATSMHPDESWAKAILKIYPSQTALLDLLSPADRESWLVKRLEIDPPQGIEVLMQYHRQFGEKITRLLLKHMPAYFLDKNRPIANLTHAVQNLGLYMEPSLVTEAAPALTQNTEVSPLWDRAVLALLQILEFRRAMREELSR